MKTHELKILPQYYDRVESGDKPFEIRYNDRDYQVGDILRLNEFIAENALPYTERVLLRTVTYITAFPDGLREGWVVMGIKP